MTRSNEINAELRAAGIEQSDLDSARATTEKLLGDYTPTTDLILDAYLRIHGRSKEVRDELSRWFEEFSRQERERAWEEGHKTPHRRGPDKCRCEAWSSSECACGKYGRGKLISLKDNPYRKETP